MSEPPFSERCSALEFLGESRQPEAFPFLINYLEDPSLPEGLSAARGLAMHRSSDAKNRLKSALNSVDSEVRESVMHWLLGETSVSDRAVVEGG